MFHVSKWSRVFTFTGTFQHKTPAEKQRNLNFRKIFVQKSFWGNAASEGSHIVNHNTVILILRGKKKSRRLLWRKRYTLRTIWSTAKVQKKILHVKYFLFHLIQVFLFHICNDIFAHRCSYLVSKALLKKHTVSIWGEGQRSLL